MPRDRLISNMEADEIRRRRALKRDAVKQHSDRAIARDFKISISTVRDYGRHDSIRKTKHANELTEAEREAKAARQRKRGYVPKTRSRVYFTTARGPGEASGHPADPCADADAAH